MLNKLYLNKKTYEVFENAYELSDLSPEWVLVPEDATLSFTNECDEEHYLVFAKEVEGAVYISHKKSPEWYFVTWRGLKDLKSCKSNNIIWEREVFEQKKETRAIKSDGGSSDYYKRPVPELMLERWKKEGFIEAKDVMKLFLGNDYNFCNSFKAHCRVQSLRGGVGKDGADEKYDLRKAWFFCEDSYKDYLERGKGDE